MTAHLKTLENTLGVALFERHPRGVSLTEVGERVLPDFTAAFAALGSAVHRLQAEAAPDLVRIAASADLVQLWLSPRLAAVRAEGLQVVLVPVETSARARGVADLVLEFVAGDGAPLIAVAAPAIAARLGDAAALEPGACLTLRGELGDWRRWTQAAGLTGFTPHGPEFASAALAIEEAANGAGVLVIAQPLAEAAQGAGRLIALFGVTAASGLALSLRAVRPVVAGSAAAQVLAALTPEG